MTRDQFYTLLFIAQAIYCQTISFGTSSGTLAMVSSVWATVMMIGSVYYATRVIWAKAKP